LAGSDRQARRRAELIIKVQSGQKTATEAANELGISRKSYYKWEKRGLEALLGAVSDRSPGRSAVPVDSEKEAMAQSLAEAERQLLLSEQRAEIRDYFLSEDDLALMKRVSRVLREKKRLTGTDGDPDGELES
jgi:transposase